MTAESAAEVPPFHEIKALTRVCDLYAKPPNLTGEKVVILRDDYKPNYPLDHFHLHNPTCGENEKKPHEDFTLVAKIISIHDPNKVLKWVWRCGKCGGIIYICFQPKDGNNPTPPLSSYRKRLRIPPRIF